MAPHFSHKWCPVAVTFANAGIPLNALILPPILTVLIEQFDWRKAYTFLACLSLLGVPASLSFYPAEVTKKSQSESEAGQQKSNKKLSRFLKNANYMLYLVSSFVVLLVMYFPATFLPDIMHAYGRSSRDVYISLMTMGLGDLAARLVVGFLVKWKPTYFAFIHSAGAIILCLSSGLITVSRSFAVFSIMSGLAGLGKGWFAGLFFVMSTHLLPAEDVKVGYGIALTFGGLAVAVGMPLAGLVTDFFGTERGAFIFSSVMFVIGSLLQITIGIREICGRTSKMKNVIELGASKIDIADEDQRNHVMEEATHI